MADMRDRLIELLRDGGILCDDCGDYGNSYCTEAIADRFLANGVILPPCKVGDTVYKVVSDKRVKRPYECKVVGFWLSKDENCNEVHLVRYVNGVFDCSFATPFANFGKTVFLTREEAEKALKEKEK